MKRHVKQFPDALKHQILQEYITTDASILELQKKYGIKSRNSVHHWMRKFGLKTPSEGEVKLNSAMAKEKDKTPQERLLEAENKKLKQELEHEKLRTLALTTLIDVAERELKVDIRKKRGAKQ